MIERGIRALEIGCWSLVVAGVVTTLWGILS